jgi:uncharacterized protein (TIRG00374 family)
VNNWKKVWNILWRVAVCLLLLGWIFQAIFWNEARLARIQLGEPWQELTRWERLHLAWTYGPPALLQTLLRVRLDSLLIAIGLMGAMIYLGILRWQIMLRVQGLDFPLRRTIQISLVGQFFNSFLLGSVGGDLLKAYYVARETHHKKAEAVVTVLVDRLLGMSSMLALSCLLMIPNRELIMSHRPLKLIALFVLLMSVGCAAAVVFAFWSGVSRGVPKARQWVGRLPKGELLLRALDASRLYGKNPVELFEAFAVSMASNIMAILHFIVLAWGFGLNIPSMAFGVLVPMITSISTLPITPSGLGVRENLYVIALAAPSIRVHETSALLLSLIAFATTLVWSAVGGLVYATMKRKEHLEEIQDSAESQE